MVNVDDVAFRIGRELRRLTTRAGEAVGSFSDGMDDGDAPIPIRTAAQDKTAGADSSAIGEEGARDGDHDDPGGIRFVTVDFIPDRSTVNLFIHPHQSVRDALIVESEVIRRKAGSDGLVVMVPYGDEDSRRIVARITVGATGFQECIPIAVLHVTHGDGGSTDPLDWVGSRVPYNPWDRAWPWDRNDHRTNLHAASDYRAA